MGVFKNWKLKIVGKFANFIRLWGYLKIENCGQICQFYKILGYVKIFWILLCIIENNVFFIFFYKYVVVIFILEQVFSGESNWDS